MFESLRDYGYTQADYSAKFDLLQKNTDFIPGRVIEHRRKLYKIVCEYGEIGAEIKGSFLYSLKGDDEFPAVGDFVLVQYNQRGNSLITSVLPRRSKFSRTNFSGHAEGYAKFIKEQVVAANFDYVFILSSLNHDFNQPRILRYLTASWESGGLPVIVLTKADLCNNPESQIAEVQKMAREVPVFLISSKTGYGIVELKPFLEAGKTIVFLGSSGVGKSSLLNCLAGKQLMEVKTIRQDDSKGRHTTTHRQLFRLPSGVLVIDTPGMRELGLWVSGDVINITFPEIEVLITQCRFSNCAHQKEPGCAIQAAIADGKITLKQWKHYQSQQRETAFVESNSDYLKQKRKFHKSIAIFSRSLKG